MKRLATLLALATTALAGGDRPMNVRVSEKAPRLAPSWVVVLREDVPHTFETRNLSKGSDTVLLLLDDREPLAWNDDRDPHPKDKHYASESRLKFTARRRGPYMLQVRPKQGTLEGTCDVYMDGKLLARRVRFGAPYHRAKREPMPMPVPYHTTVGPMLDIYELEHPDR